MTAAILIAKLLELEKAIGKLPPLALRHMVLEAQGCVLEMEQQMIETLRENGRLCERMESCEQSTQTRSPNLRSFPEMAPDLSQVLGRKAVASEAPLSSSVLPKVFA